MASGFMVLPDGRCFSRRWSVHDAVLHAVAEEVTAEPLRHWLLEQLPGPEDEEEIGYGAWLRNADQTIVAKFIDLRLMTVENQRLFSEAAKTAALVPRHEDWVASNLLDLADMVSRVERGELPLSKSDWVVVMPPEGGKIGPGWPVK